MSPKQVRDKAQRIIEMWHSGVRNKSEIARRVECSKSNVNQVLARHEGMPPPKTKRHKSLTCQRPDVENGLKPCGRPLHTIAGERLGICEHHWNTLKPLGGAKQIISGKRGSKGY